MKITLVRVRGSKDPAMVLLWHPSKKINEAGFFGLVDECCNPNDCEFWETEIDSDCFGIYWPSEGNEELTDGAGMQLFGLFNTDHIDWIKIDFHFDDENF